MSPIYLSISYLVMQISTYVLVKSPILWPGQTTFHEVPGNPCDSISILCSYPAIQEAIKFCLIA